MPLSSSSKSTLTQSILSEVEKKRIYPRFFFILANILIGLGSVFLVFVAIFFINIIIFKYRSLYDGGCFCWEQLTADFWGEFPWLPIIISAICLIGGYLLLRHFRVVYQRRWVSILLAVIIVSVVGAILIDLSGLNEKLLNTKLFPAYCSLGKSQCYVNDDHQCRPRQPDQLTRDCPCD